MTAGVCELKKQLHAVLPDGVLYWAVDTGNCETTRNLPKSAPFPLHASRFQQTYYTALPGWFADFDYKQMTDNECVDLWLDMDYCRCTPTNRGGNAALSNTAGIVAAYSRYGGASRRRDCRFADTPCSSTLKHLLNVEGGAAE